MKENHANFYRTLKLAASGALIATALTACNQEQTTPPEGFTRNEKDYSWKIVIDVQNGDGGKSYAEIYSNDRPTLVIDGGVSKLTASNIYCPTATDWRGSIGCTDEFISEYELATPKRISISPQAKKIQ